MITLSFINLRTRISQLTDETVTASGAQPQALVDSWINEAIANYETERAKAAGGTAQRVATVTTTSSSTPGTHSFPANEVVPLEAMAGNVRAVLSVWSVNPRYQLQPMLPQDRTAQVYSNRTRPGRPQSYQVIEVAEAAPTNELMLRIWPPADSAYSLEVNYLPNFTSLAADGDLFQYVEGTLELLDERQLVGVTQDPGLHFFRDFEAFLLKRFFNNGVHEAVSLGRICSSQQQIRHVLACCFSF